MTEFFCFPVCLNCKNSGTCVKMLPKMESVELDEIVVTRRPRNFNIPSAYLPCGCFGLPWPIIATFGKNIESVLCETHGWVDVKRGYKFSSKPPEVKKPKKKGSANAAASIPFLHAAMDSQLQLCNHL